MPKIVVKIADISIFGHFVTFIGIYALQKHMYIVEEVLNLWIIYEN